MGFLAEKIKRVLRQCRISRDGDDLGDFPIQQVEYLGKVGDAAMWFPFGFHANVNEDSLGMMFTISGNDDARVVFAGSPEKRPRLEPGELVVFHPKTQSRIHFKANGDVEITSTTKLKVDTPTVQFTGNVDIDGNLNVDGDAVIDGDADVAGTVTGTVDVLAGATSISGLSHQHTISGGSSAGTTTPPI